MGGVAQILAGLMEFRVGNTFGTAVHCSYGAFWLSYAMFQLPSVGIKQAYGEDVRALTFALGIYMLVWCFMTIVFFLAALRTNITILSVLFFVIVAFFLLSIANFIATSHPVASIHVNQAGGALAVVAAFLAFYAGAAGIMTEETTFIRLPLGVIPRKDSNI